MKRKLSKIFAVMLAFVMVLSLAACGSGSDESSDANNEATENTGEETVSSDDDEIVIGVAWKTLQEQRWVDELDIVEDVCKEMGVEMIYQVSDNDTQKMIGQIENMITQGIDILICCPSELEGMANIYQEAHEAGVLVVNYEMCYGDVYIDMCGGLDNYEVGLAITESLAEIPLSGKVAYIGGDASGGTTQFDFMDGMKDSLKDCDIEEVGEQWSTLWDAAIAQGFAENWITQYGEDLSAIIPMNDGMAGGVAQAIEAADLTGKILVVGQDAEVTACQRIAAGTQYSTVYKNSQEAARKVVECAIKLYKGELTEADYGGKTAKSSDGSEVPFAAVEPVVVTKDNLDKVMIDSGIYTHDEVYNVAD
ncbi:MAG: substrate-binding domain-containing protein [Suipraeoptans sp.]